MGAAVSYRIVSNDQITVPPSPIKSFLAMIGGSSFYNASKRKRTYLGD